MRPANNVHSTKWIQSNSNAALIFDGNFGDYNGKMLGENSMVIAWQTGNRLFADGASIHLISKDALLSLRALQALCRRMHTYIVVGRG